MGVKNEERRKQRPPGIMPWPSADLLPWNEASQPAASWSTLETLSMEWSRSIHGTSPKVTRDFVTQRHAQARWVWEKLCHLQRLSQSMQRLGPRRGQIDCLPGICFCLHISHHTMQTSMIILLAL